MARARDFTASVLARPGTASTRMCPRARRATSSRSSSTSWPTMVFLTSYRTCSMGFVPVSTGPSSRDLGWGRSLLGRPVTAGPGDGGADGYGEPDADERAGGRRGGPGDHDADPLTPSVDPPASRAAPGSPRVE